MSRRCPKCFWTLYDGDWCQNPDCVRAGQPVPDGVEMSCHQAQFAMAHAASPGFPEDLKKRVAWATCEAINKAAPMPLWVARWACENARVNPKGTGQGIDPAQVNLETEGDTVVGAWVG